MLKHHGNAKLACHMWISDVYRLTVPADFASIGFDRAEDDFHQSRFTGAILAEHGVNFPWGNIKIDVVIGQYPRVGLAYVRYFKTSRRGGHGFPFTEVPCGAHMVF